MMNAIVTLLLLALGSVTAQSPSPIDPATIVASPVVQDIALSPSPVVTSPSPVVTSPSPVGSPVASPGVSPGSPAAAQAPLPEGLGASTPAGQSGSFGTWYKDDIVNHECYYRGDTAVPNTVAINPANWPSTGAWAGKAKCGTCFVVSCDSAGSTYGIPGSTSCARRSTIVQITNACPECGEKKGSWGSCTTCTNYHVDLWYTTYAALTGCDPTKGGCNPGVIPVTIGDPVPCPTTTPKVFYRSSEAFYQAVQITGMDGAFKSATLTNVPGMQFRVQTSTFVKGVLLNLDGVVRSSLPATLNFVIADMDGRSATCTVPTGAIGTTTPCTPFA